LKDLNKSQEEGNFHYNWKGKEVLATMSMSKFCLNLALQI
jgi:hypothetical protein